MLPINKWLCHQCWRMQTVNVYVGCQHAPNCLNMISDRAPIICGECALSENAFVPNGNNNAEQMLINLLESELTAIG